MPSPPVAIISLSYLSLSELRSDVTGKVVRFLQQDGENVEKDQPYVEVGTYLAT